MKRGKHGLEEQQGKGLGMHQKEPLCQLGRQESIPIESCDKIGQQEVEPEILLMIRITKAMKTLSHTAKSAVIVVGGQNQKILKIREELKQNPVLLSEKPVHVKESEPYLGFQIHEN